MFCFYYLGTSLPTAKTSYGLTAMIVFTADSYDEGTGFTCQAIPRCEDTSVCFECSEDPPAQEGYVFSGTGMTRNVTCMGGFTGDPADVTCIDTDNWEEAEGCVGPVSTFIFCIITSSFYNCSCIYVITLFMIYSFL